MIDSLHVGEGYAVKCPDSVNTTGVPLADCVNAAMSADATWGVVLRRDKSGRGNLPEIAKRSFSRNSSKLLGSNNGAASVGVTIDL